VDFDWLARLMPEHVREQTRKANSALEVELLARGIGFGLPRRVAISALGTVRNVLKDAPIEADIVIVGREGEILARA
jgi:cobalt-precorrin-5B (C1)-methyltransferase